MDYGIQIYGCLEEFRKNPEAFFRRLSDAGYRLIEPCILFDDPVKTRETAISEGNTYMLKMVELLWKPEEVPGFIALMDQYNLKLDSVHIFAKDMNEAADLMIETAKKNHIRAYVQNSDQHTIEKEYVNYANQVSKLSRALMEHGIELWLHNHGMDIRIKVEHIGRKIPVLSAVLDLCKEAKVGAQIDVGWVLYGGIDPVEYLQEVKGYIRSIHFKDFKKDFENRRENDVFAYLGDGALNTKEVLNYVPSLCSDLTVYVDQDASDSDIMEDLVKSYQVLREAENDER